MSIVGSRGSYRYVGVRYREDRSLDPNGRKCRMRPPLRQFTLHGHRQQGTTTSPHHPLQKGQYLLP